MGDAARDLLKSFESLPEAEQREVLDEGLLRAADQVFQVIR